MGQAPDGDLLARLARLGVQLGTEGIGGGGRRGEGDGTDGTDRTNRTHVTDRPRGSTDAPPLEVDVQRPSADSSYSSHSSYPSYPPPHPAVLPLEAALPGADWPHQTSSCWVTSARRPLDDRHADELLEAGLRACTSSLSALAGDPALAGMDLERTAFLDTETTGLAGGAGTYAFLIGIGRLEGGCFHVRQFFMRHPGEERAQLAAVAEWLEGCSGLVTFNGRSFDMPLLATRCTVHRRRPFLDGAPHLDLLPAARRVWRRRLESCSLTSLEREILGTHRQDDVPGWLIPYRYFRYQQDGDARPLVGIFHHNLLDILTMVSLTARLARAWQAPEDTLDHGLDWLSLARRYELSGDSARAMAACEGALSRGLSPAETDDALQQLSLIARRAGDWQRATAVWRDLAAESQPRRLFPFEELAKYWEHRASPPDLARALAISLEAHERVASGALRPRRGVRQSLTELDHRIARLQRRLGGGSSGRIEAGKPSPATRRGEASAS